MVERTTSTEETVTTAQPVPVTPTTTERTVTRTTEAAPVVAPVTEPTINVNAPSGTDTAGITSVNVPPAGGVTTTTTTTTPDVNVNTP